jgi:hypothetical protein
MMGIDNRLEPSGFKLTTGHTIREKGEVAMKIAWKSVVGSLSITLMLFGVAVSSGGAELKKADLVLKNGKIVTVDPSQSEFQALAVMGHTIKPVGTNREIAGHIGPAGLLTFAGGGHIVLRGRWHAVWLMIGFRRKCPKPMPSSDYRGKIAC